LPIGTYHKNLVIWEKEIFANLENLGSFFFNEIFFVYVKIIYFRSKFGAISPRRGETKEKQKQY
jgi:hypothetical protein